MGTVARKTTIIPELTRRQLQIIRLAAEGKRNWEIAEALGLSIESVKTYIARIREKLGLATKTELAIWGSHHLERHHGRIKSH